MRRLGCSLFLLASLLGAEDKISVFGKTWTVPSTADWKVSLDDGAPMLQLIVGREPAPGPRKPGQFALLEMEPASHVVLEADVRPTKRSLMIVYAYQDESHFDYVHFSTDTAMKQAVHNGVFHVYGGERVRISNRGDAAAFPGINQWFHIKVEWDGRSGEVQGFVNGAAVAALHAVDLSLQNGRIGIGSFDETGDFKNLTVTAAGAR